jgi:hypothetical protein
MQTPRLTYRAGLQLQEDAAPAATIAFACACLRLPRHRRQDRDFTIVYALQHVGPFVTGCFVTWAAALFGCCWSGLFACSALFGFVTGGGGPRILGSKAATLVPSPQSRPCRSFPNTSALWRWASWCVLTGPALSYQVHALRL